MKLKWYLTIILIITSLASCKKYLDVVPDNVATLNNAFTMRSEAEKYLATCYSFLGNDGDPQLNVAYLGGDELWLNYPPRAINAHNWDIARGNQNVVSPYVGIWGTEYEAIRICNTFLENIVDTNKVKDLQIDERTRWIGEAMFLKAYYHFLLFRQYGPIAIVDKNLPIDAPLEQTKVKRLPVDTVVNYIANLMDSASKLLPYSVINPSTDYGHITRPIALAMRAKVLVYGASPLFNGNNDYSNFKNKDGQLLINTTFDISKWQRAALAAKEAIDACETAGISLYHFINTTGYTLSDATMTQMSIRNAVCEKWNQEIIWGNSNSSTWQLQYSSMAHIDPNNAGNSSIYGVLGPTMGIVEQFYTKNGVPITEDKTLDFSNITALRTATHDERFNLIEGYQTARINFDREPRFYADLGFDGGVWYMQNSPSHTDENTWNLQDRLGQFGAGVGATVTTYYPKKMVNWKFTFNADNSSHIEDYPFPMMRLADLYLLYAEALNETSGPSDEVYEYLNRVRARAGLPTVQESWTNYSNNPAEYTTKEGLRTIIREERANEMAFEGSRFWDLRRWKLAAQVLNENIIGWDASGTAEHPELFYKLTTYYTMHFIAPRDYLWPLSESDLNVNENLVQNPGW
ncbi:carbohydrate-binding protein SusD [Arachidicoccus ginsenosidimutans]|uniref:RagB/SusD family nutrient uptake outer membrane protein n=1 Tax=Arachidicoccus sp. BS20 TaxID=1850526 RepID=UPI0007F0A538|nr:RagB/SusD family nutrient uptake outer membrane protein [Arachidicoccus sp. BS20]ANI88336.1 carbohydrate-binding protein SusD [Arachidicoccus sp. BS20]ANI88342.1 carbohydrate-binding protein SusD [Arachidicoccus sp. BS20]